MVTGVASSLLAGAYPPLFFWHSGNLHRHSSVNGTSSFLAAWDGRVWQSQGSVFDGTSAVTQLAMVPMQNEHTAQGLIEGDRMLLLSGSLVVSSFGQASSMLFDGESFIPYIVSASADGSPGYASGIFNSISNFSFAQRRKSCQIFLISGANDTKYRQISLPLVWSS
jgi:Cortical protein marker for cell polarity